MHQPQMLAVEKMAAVVLLLLTAPLMIELFVLTTASLFPGKRRRFSNAAARKLMIVVPAHNEGALVERCVLSIAKQLGVTASLLVVAHNCMDDTADRALMAGADVVRLDDPTQRGKACALRFGFTHALRNGAEAVVVVDADSVVDGNFVETMQAALSGESDAVQCRYRVLPAGKDGQPSLTGIAFQGFNLVRPRGRNRLGLSAGIFGNGFGMRREVLERVPYRADSVVEDLEYHIQLVAAGIRVDFLESATVFGEMPQGNAGNQTQRARWEGGRILMIRAYLYRLPSQILQGHLRLTEPFLDILSMPIAMGALLLLLALVLPLEWIRWYAAAGLGLLAFHFTIAVKAGPDFWAGMRVIALAPRYMLWKVLLFPKILLSSRRNASWVRTERDEPAEFSSSAQPDAVE